MISYNIGQLAYLNAMRYNIKRIFFGGLGAQGRGREGRRKEEGGGGGGRRRGRKGEGGGRRGKVAGGGKDGAV